MAISNLPAPPLRTDDQSVFSSKMETFLTALPVMVTEFNATATTAQLSTTTTSTTSVLIGTGSKSFTVQTGLGFVAGMTLRLAFDSLNYMTGDVISYNSGTGALVMNITAIVGSGTRASWAISLAAVGASTAGTVSFTPAGSIAATNVQSALQELDTEKLSSAAGAVTGTSLEDITTAETVGSSYQIPVVTFDVNGRATSKTSAPKLVSGTAIATTSGTSHDFASIPSGVKRIALMLSSLSTNGTSSLIVQLGDSGGIENSGYLGAETTSVGASSLQNTTGFAIKSNVAAAAVHHGIVTLILIDATSNTWAQSGNISLSNTTQVGVSAGSKSLSSPLDRIRLTTVNGTDTFDAGSINILME